MRSFSEAKILVVDSSPVLRGELAGRLGTMGFHVVVGDHAAGVGRVVELFKPDVAVVELLSDRHDEIERTVRALNASRVIVTLDASVPADRRVCAIRAGADDVVVKPLDVDELLLRIESVMRDYGDDAVLTFDDVTVDEVGHLVRRGDETLDLTVTEFKLLTMLVRNAGRVLSKRQLLATVWGFDDYDVNLVEVHVSALRRKLEANGPRIVQTVRGIGYVIRSVAPSCEASGERQLSAAS